jgi:eukaryotic translation initiation factor 2C
MLTPSRVAQWMVVIYERQQRFNDQTANQMANDLVKACEAVGTTTSCSLSDHPAHPSLIGIKIANHPALITWESGQGNIGQVCDRLSTHR